MALPQDPQAAASMIDQMASSKMGVSPQMAQPAPAAPKDKDSAEDKASAKGSPQTEGDKMSAEAIVYEIDMGDGKKPNQIHLPALRVLEPSKRTERPHQLTGR